MKVKRKQVSKRTVTTIATTDLDTIAAVERFNADGRYVTYSEALNKLVARAVRAGIHTYTDEQFDRFLKATMLHIPVVGIVNASTEKLEPATVG